MLFWPIMVENLDKKPTILEFDFASIRHSWILVIIYFASFDAFLAKNGRELDEKTTILELQADFESVTCAW